MHPKGANVINYIKRALLQVINISGKVIDSDCQMNIAVWVLLLWK